jgi:Protein of unknown function DUF262
MQVTPSTFTVAQYCHAFEAKEIVVNNDYQRGRVWPPAARSYLIDTLLSGYPIPKMSLYQKTDLRTRQTINEIVDGQQRSVTIYDFFSNNLRLSGRSSWGGKRYDDLDEDEQQRFVAYQLSVDLFVAATESDIRQVFRRMNSYTVPLNKQEQRHATYQGDFKWFIVEMVELYSQALRDTGVFTERNLARMDDAKLLTDICFSVSNGIKSQSEKLLDEFYAEGEQAYEMEAEMRSRLEQIFSVILEWRDLHDGPLMRSYQVYTLALAITHCQQPVDELNDAYQLDGPVRIDNAYALPNLTLLAETLENPEAEPDLADFVHASSAATTRIGPRTTRFQRLCEALQPSLMAP